MSHIATGVKIPHSVNEGLGRYKESSVTQNPPKDLVSDDVDGEL